MEQRQWGFGFALWMPYGTEEEACVAVREEAGLLDSDRQALQGFRGSFKRKRAFVRGTSGERELGVQGLRVRSPLVKFSFL